MHVFAPSDGGYRAELEALLVLRDDKKLLEGVCTLLFPDYDCFGFSFSGCRNYRYTKHRGCARVATERSDLRQSES